MTNKELNEKRLALQAKRLKVEKAMSPMAVMGDIKAAALIAAEITDELARRELAREGAPHGQ